MATADVGAAAQSPGPARRSAPTAGRGRFGALGSTLSMIAFQHTLFALPFAFTAAVLAARGMPSWWQIGWMLGAMVGARSAAMVWNRIVDLRFDRANPRTAGRALVTGELGMPFARGFFVAALALFYLSAAMLTPLALRLATPAAIVILSYSYAKRFTWLTHLHLGASLGIAPLGAWVAVRGQFDTAPVILGAAVMFWVAGFDIIYSCQDVEFDRRTGLHSIPARFGIGPALRVAAAFHAVTVLLLLALPACAPLGRIYLAGVIATAALLLHEHRLVRPDDLSRVNRAFFTVNGVVGFVILAATIADIMSG